MLMRLICHLSSHTVHGAPSPVPAKNIQKKREWTRKAHRCTGRHSVAPRERFRVVLTPETADSCRSKYFDIELYFMFLRKQGLNLRRWSTLDSRQPPNTCLQLSQRVQALTWQDCEVLGAFPCRRGQTRMPTSRRQMLGWRRMA